MPTKLGRIRGGPVHSAVGPSQTRLARLGSRLIQWGNSINDQSPGKWVDAGVRLLRTVAHQNAVLASAWRTKYVEARRSFRERRTTEDPSTPPASPGEQRVRVERGNVISREDASLEVFAAIEHERERIGRDLHDGLGNLLTAVGFMSSALCHSLRGTNHPDAGRAEELAALIHQISGNARKLVRGIAKSPVEEAGLVHALDEFAADIRRWFEVDCGFECDEFIGPVISTLPLAVGTELYRIAQAAVTNAIRQSSASDIRIRLCRIDGEATEPPQLALTVEDNGPKNDGSGKAIVNAGQGDGFAMGQEIMRCRARSIGATLVIVPRSAGGTIVSCGLPLVDRSSPIEKSRHLIGRELAMSLRVASVDR